MPIEVGASSTGAASGTQDVKVVAWDSTTTGRVVVLSQTGTQTVNVVASTAVAMSGTGNVTIAGQPIGISGTITGIVAASGTQNVIVVGQSTTANVTIVNTAGPYTISGSASVINTVAVSGSVTAIGIATTADFFCIPTGNTLRYAGTSTNVNNLYLTITTSAAVILVTSAASKVHIITSLWLNGNIAAAFKLQSATTDIGTMFIATSGVGVVLGHNDHGWNRTTAGQSLVASAAASGSYSGWISYITISG